MNEDTSIDKLVVRLSRAVALRDSLKESLVASTYSSISEAVRKSFDRYVAEAQDKYSAINGAEEHGNSLYIFLQYYKFHTEYAYRRVRQAIDK